MNRIGSGRISRRILGSGQTGEVCPLMKMLRLGGLRIYGGKRVLLVSIFLMLVSGCSLYDSPETCVVRYHGNGATEGRPPLDAKFDINEVSFSPRGNIFGLGKGNAAFLHWNSKPDGTGFTFVPGKNYSVDVPMLDLYAQWSVIGARGPSGGYIFYENENWKEDGWRYLEAAAADQSEGVVWGILSDSADADKGFSHGLAAGSMNTFLYRRQMAEGSAGEDEVSAFTCLRGAGTAAPEGGVDGGADADADAEGSRSADAAAGDAASAGWYLPSREELLLMYEQLQARGIGGFADADYWSSSPGNEPETAWAVRFDGGDSDDSGAALFVGSLFDGSFEVPFDGSGLVDAVRGGSGNGGERPVGAARTGDAADAGEAALRSASAECRVRAVRKVSRLSGGDGSAGEEGEFRIVYSKLGEHLETGSVPTNDERYGGGRIAAAAENSGGLAAGDRRFLCWNTEKNGSGERFYPGDPVIIATESIILYPVYTIVGQVGEAGGLLFYENENWKADGWRYLEAAAADIDETGICPRYTGLAVFTGIGTGDLNTSLIVEAHPDESGPAAICRDLATTHEGVIYDDWYLPSTQELAVMLGSFSALPGGLDAARIDQSERAYYLSSTNDGSDSSRYVVAVHDGQAVFDIPSYMVCRGHIRPIRKVYQPDAERPEHCSVIYHRGDADAGAVPDRQDGIAYGTALRVQPLPEDAPLQRQYYRFVGWNTRSDGSGISYLPGDIIIAGSGDSASGSEGTAGSEVVGIGSGTVDLYPEWTVIGAEGPAGGTIFYENENWEEDGWRYLEYADVMLEESYAWGPTSYVMGTSPDIGAGQRNTGLIIKAHGDGEYAALAANDFSRNGYDDWFLPSSGELKKVAEVRKLVDADGSSSWPFMQSSTQTAGSFIYYITDEEATEQYNKVVSYREYNFNKSDRHHVLCVRSFLDVDDPGEVYNLSFSLHDGVHVSSDAYEPWSALRLPEELPSYGNSPFSLAGWMHADGTGSGGGMGSDVGAADAAEKRYAPGALFVMGEHDVTLSAEFSAVGSTGPAGGLIFYENPNSDWEEDGWRYLEAALDPQPTEFPYYTDFGELSSDIGLGELNTVLVGERYAHHDEYFFNQALEYTKNGYDDWFVPAKETLRVLNDYLLSHDAYEVLENGTLSSSTYENEKFYYVRYWSSGSYYFEEEYAYYEDYDYSYMPIRAFGSFSEEEETYALHFDLNGADSGADELDAVTGFEALDVGTVPYAHHALSRGPYSCAGWNTQPDGFGTSYVEDDAIRFDGRDITLYAMWEYVGGPGEAGGTIIYDNPFYRTDGWRFMEAAPSGIDYETVWGAEAVSVGAFRTSVRDGIENNELWFLDEHQPAESAFTACADYAVNGYDDWFLPSLDEMLLVREYAPGFQGVYYWTSSEADADSAYFVRGSYQSNLTKNYTLYAYPVRVCGGADGGADE